MSTKIEKLKRRAREHEQREEWSEAMEAYTQALDESVEQDDPDIALHNRIGDLQIRLGNRDGAMASYERAIDLYLEGDLPNNAMAVCRKLQRNAPDRTSTLLRMGQIRIQQGFVVDARQNFLSYAEARVAQGQGDEGLRALEEFAALAPEDVQVRVFLATFLEQQDRTEEAIGHLRAAYRYLRDQGENEEAAGLRSRVQEMAPEVDVEAEALREEARGAAGVEESDLDEFSMEWHESGDGDRRDDPDSAPHDPLGGTMVDLDASEASWDDPEPVRDPAPVPGPGSELDTDPASGGGFSEDELEGLEGGYDWVHGTPAEPSASDTSRSEPPTTEPSSAEPPASDSPRSEPSATEAMEPEPEVADAEVADAEVVDAMEWAVEEAAADPAPDSWDEDVPDDESWDDPEPLPLLDDPVADTPSGEAPESGEPHPGEAVEVAPTHAEPPETRDAGPSRRDTLMGLRAMVTRDPSDAESWRRLGAVLLDEEMEEEARIALRKAHETYAEQGDPEKAMRVVRDIIFLDPDDLDPHKRLVEYAHQTRDRALLVPAFVELAEVLERTGAGRKAEAVYGQILAMDPRNPRALGALARLTKEDEVQAQESALASTAPAPSPPPEETPGDTAAPGGGTPSEFVNLGGMVLDGPAAPSDSFRWKVPVTDPSGDEDADFARMLAQFKQKVARDMPSDDIIARYDLGAAFKEMGLLDEAISEFQQVIRAKPRHLASYEMVGQCFLDKGEPEVAARLLKRAIDVGHDVEDELIGIYYFLAQAQESAGNPESAREFYERVFSLDINFRDVTERLRVLR
ncbi:MAG: hypothetical protein EA422_01495 [Gemmatimonadales bacterium]|nr:MAG: hypothetical protein EA422_01495 [Gemmatimonadales bacterium]